VPRRRLRGVRPAVQSLDPHPPHQRDHPVAADLHTVGPKQIAQHPAARERRLQVQLVQLAHDRQIGRRHRPRVVVQTAPAELEKLRLTPQRKLVLTVDHRFALGMPTLPSAPNKKSFSNASWPIFACRSFRSTAAGATKPPPITPAAPSRSCARQAVIWFG